MINEFDGRSFPCTSFVPSYPDASGTTRSCSMKGAIPGEDFVQGSAFVGVSYQYYRANLWRNFGILIAFMLFFLATYMFAVEYVSAAKSKGEVLVFRRGHLPPALKKSDSDEEGRSTGEKEVVRTMDDVKKEKAQKASGDQNASYEQKDIFMWRDVCYDIKIKKQDRRLLDHVEGWYVFLSASWFVSIFADSTHS